MFKTKYNASILDVNWLPLKRGLKLDFIPRKDEFIFIENEYYRVVNVVHLLNKNQEAFIVIEKLPNKIDIKISDFQSIMKNI